MVFAEPPSLSCKYTDAPIDDKPTARSNRRSCGKGSLIRKTDRIPPVALGVGPFPELRFVDVFWSSSSPGTPHGRNDALCTFILLRTLLKDIRPKLHRAFDSRQRIACRHRLHAGQGLPTRNIP